MCVVAARPAALGSCGLRKELAQLFLLEGEDEYTKFTSKGGGLFPF